MTEKNDLPQHLALNEEFRKTLGSLGLDDAAIDILMTHLDGQLAMGYQLGYNDAFIGNDQVIKGLAHLEDIEKARSDLDVFRRDHAQKYLNITHTL